MATPSTSSSPSSFLNLPPPIRQKIYAHLLAPHPEEDVTTINYTLTWNWFENQSNTTFAGVEQIDLCRCPQHRTHDIPTEDHIYTRYRCHNPEVGFKSAREDLWMLSEEYLKSGQINFLRPATEVELARRPNGNVLSTCKMVYQEAVPMLYRGRNFLFLTGPCPRGRYQAYATQTFLTRLTPLARSHVTTLSIIAQNYEEDCHIKDIGGAYANLAVYIVQSLPSFRTLCFNLWDERFKDLTGLLCGIFVKEGVSICLAADPVGGRVVDCKDPQSCGMVLGGIGMLPCPYASDVRKDLRDAVAQKVGKDTGRLPEERAWEEFELREDVWAVFSQTSRKPEERRQRRIRRVSKVQRVVSTSQDKSKGNMKEEVQEVEDDDEWVDATPSPGSAGGGNDGDAESWEML